MRPARPEDVSQIFRILRGEVTRGRQDVAPNEDRVARTLARFDWEARSRVVVRNGEVVAAAFVVSRPAPEGAIATVYAGGDTGEYRDCVRWGVALARAAGAGAIQVFAGKARRGDLVGLGLEPVRPWWRMDRSLAGGLAPVEPIAGYVLIDGRSAPPGSWAQTFNRTFADHWRFAPRLEDEIVAERPPELCVMAVTSSGQMPVALTLGELDLYPGDPRPQPVGIVSSVGTVPDHRRRGLARWLVTEMLRRLRDAGARHASLYVDGLNATRPADIYKKLGFGVAFEADVWEASSP
jgi:ribosomal protein S18 acetylase RimI-like enzyme